jgi:hypothetical protein
MARTVDNHRPIFQALVAERQLRAPACSGGAIMSPFMGQPIGFNPATLALLDAALTDMYNDFARRNAEARIGPAAAPLVSEIDITRTGTPKPRALIVPRNRQAKKLANNLRFNRARGWYLR